MKFEAHDAVAQVEQIRATVRLEDSLETVERREAHDAVRFDERLITLGREIEVGERTIAPVVEGFLGRRQDRVDQRRGLAAVLAHALDGFFNAKAVPDFEDAAFPVETRAHRRIDGHDVVGDFGDARGRVEKQIAQRFPQKLPSRCR